MDMTTMNDNHEPIQSAIGGIQGMFTEDGYGLSQRNRSYQSATAGNDMLQGDLTHLTLHGLAGNDLISGVMGQTNVLFGNEGHDRLRGGDQDDVLNGGSGSDRLWSNRGNDLLIGGSGDDRLLAGQGDDTLKGGSGKDLLTGDDGNDLLAGGSGFDRLNGGDGNDRLMDYEGGDRLTGGRGADQFGVGGALSTVASIITDFKVGTDQVKVLRLGATYENLTFQKNQGGTLVMDQGQAIAQLEGIKPRQLKADSFLFGNAQLATELQTNLTQSLADNPNATGLAAVTFAPDGTVWQGFTGLSSRETQAPVDANSVFGIGSITKPIVATTILQLYEEGKLNLNDTVSQWLPNLSKSITNADRITIRQLLGHTSGIPEYLDQPEARAQFFADPKAFFNRTIDVKELLSFIQGKPALGEPGAAFFYSNTNFVLLGQIVEKATGTTLAKQLRERIFEPLGLSQTFYAPQEAVSRGNITRTYSELDDDGKITTADYLNEVDEVSKQGLTWAAGAGGIVSTAAELAKIGQALFQGELLAPATLQMMISDNSDLFVASNRPAGSAPNGLESDFYGLGIESGSLAGIGNFLRHNGATIGWGSELTYLPARQITATVLASQPTPTGASEQEDSSFIVVTKNIQSIVRQYYEVGGSEPIAPASLPLEQSLDAMQ
jgi:CubicO group peptidase (beta-lactamase class C family)